MNEFMLSHSHGSGQVPVCTLSDSTLGEMRHANQNASSEEKETSRKKGSCWARRGIPVIPGLEDPEFQVRVRPLPQTRPN